MRLRRRPTMGLALVGTGAMLALSVAATAPAQAAPVVRAAAVSGAVPFSQSDFSGYGTGTELHVGAVTEGSTQVASIDQAFSGASTKFAGSTAGVGLTTPINSETGAVVSPAEPASVNAYGNGVGLEVGLGNAVPATTNTDQVQLAGLATQMAPPDAAPVTTSEAIPSTIPSAVASGGLLNGRAAAFFDPTGCPLGQPISYGLGDASNVGLLDLGGLTGSSMLSGGPTLQTAGSSGNGTAESTAYTYLDSNGNGTYGLASTTTETIAPLTVNILGALQLQVDVVTANGSNAPVTLTSVTTGGTSGAKVSFSSAGIVQVNAIEASPTGGAPTTTNLVDIPLSSVGPNGLHIPLSVKGLSSGVTSLLGTATSVVSSLPGGAGSALAGVLGGTGITSQLAGLLGTTTSALSGVLPDLSLGSLDIDTSPHAIGQAATTPPTMVGGTQAGGALDLLHLDLNVTLPAGALPTALPSLDLATVDLGHLEAAAATSAPILCDLPVIKSANPTQVTAGGQFVYTIMIPDPAKLADLDCSLSDVSAVDTITDYQGQPLFDVTAASNGGSFVNDASQMSSTVRWSGLNYVLAAAGQPAAAPITLTVTVNTPANSPSGVIQDLVNATGTASDCTGGVTGVANLGGVNGNVLTGSYALQQPSVAANPVAPASAARPAATLPFTGGPSGLWQPLGGVAALVVGGGAILALRRTRRLG